MNLILFDDPSIRIELLPFTFTRPVAAIRVGILTLAEKWEKYLNVTASYKTEAYLQQKYPIVSTPDNLLVNGALCADPALAAAVKALPDGYFLVKDSLLLAARNPTQDMSSRNTIEYPESLTVIDKPWRIFRENGAQIRADFKLITAGRTSARIDDRHTRVYGEENLFVEEGVYIRAAVLNAENGPIYLGKGSQIHEGSLVRGAFALGEGSQLNMGAKIRGDVTIGPHSKVGGEVSNSILFAYSNKAHDGFLGNSVIGEWCNFGADSNTSNMKNNYDVVKIWRHGEQRFVPTELNFCGLMMGDHSKCSINTMFNTGTVVDVSASIFGEGFPSNYVPSFSWGGGAGFTTYQVDKALETAARVMGRRNVELTRTDADILLHVYNTTAHSRTWETK
ncbi:GlmU family protein [Chryseolinea lacunae]|uniref:GlmU family protein n=1 Tax=Chryseolinea lacunae TaxID=2801331 RepID=A0ABS1KL80_9BACT|nr:GlmU family protein [Chryseolinea lacunae]MBL0740216.1 GlmU family protein [Chryseolinea lacunae]